MRVLTVFGTRPEAIKMAPVVHSLSRHPGIESGVCITSQHQEMLTQVLDLFGIKPDYDLDVMRPGQDLTHITTAVLTRMRDALRDFQPDRVVVHGDTSTTFSASLSAFYQKTPVAHVEAGLRTGDRYSPWPEEMNRKLTDGIADLLFAPTERARKNLLAEGADPASVEVTGNTVIDALFHVLKRLETDRALHDRVAGGFPFLRPDRRLVLVTSHRRENFGDGISRICRAIARVARRPDVQVVFPVHRNPNILSVVEQTLGKVPAVHLIDPVDYLSFVFLMQRSYLLLSDSGGIQEEAPALGKPVLVMRQATERQEAIEAGTVRLVGTDADRIVTETERLLDDPDAYARMSSAVNPFGDGKASERIVARVTREAGDRG